MTLLQYLQTKIIPKVSTQIAEEVLAEATKLVPVKTGNLRDSGHIHPAPGGGRVVRYDAKYALIVHERPATRGYKWLERAVVKVAKRNKGRKIR